MEKRALALAAVFATGTMGFATRTQAPPKAAATRTQAPPKAAAPSAKSIEIGSTFVVEPPISAHVRTLSQRERRDQLRDWAVLGTVGRLAATAEQAAAATYELPPMRLPFLEALYAFEYGRGRRAYLGDRVLLFSDSDDPAAEVTIGRLADRVRMENGDGFARVEVYVVTDDREAGEIKIERQRDVTHDTLFSKAYGYVEGQAGDEMDLVGWLEQTDDLTYVRQLEDGRLKLGGRRFAKHPTPNLTLVDVAAIYQAHDEMTRQQGESGAPGFSLDPTWLPSTIDPQQLAIRDALRSFAKNPCADLARVAERARKLLQQEPDPTRRTARTTWAAKIVRVARYAPLVCGTLGQTVAPELARIAEDLTAAGPDGWDRALVPFYQLRDGLNESAEGRVANFALEFHAADSSVQCARYDGLVGTEVGMTLFYTDLLAKLWMATDFKLSAPTLALPGFLAAPQLNLPSSFRREDEKAPATRVWFGSRDSAVSRRPAARYSDILFAHQFSRIYAAGSIQGVPNVETRPSESSRRTIGWWDQHFDDVADYEPQYHRQNQIMKWSLVTAAMHRNVRWHALRRTTVDRSQVFAAWQQAHARSLRFADALPVPHQLIPGRECLPLISSYPFETEGSTGWFIAGGVSLAGERALRRTATLESRLPLGQRRAIGGGDLERAGIDLGRATPVRAKSVVKFDVVGDSPTVPATGFERPISLDGLHVGYELVAGNGVAIKASAGTQAVVGELRIVEATTRPNATRLSWEPGNVGGAERVELPHSAAEADAAVRAGHYEVGAAYYQTLGRVQSSLSAARTMLMDIVRQDARGGLADLAMLEKRAKAGEALPGTARDPLLDALASYEGATVARVGAAMLDGAGATDMHLAARHGHIVATRNFARAEVVRPLRKPIETLDPERLYIADDVNLARDGFAPETGGQAARWKNVPNVKIEELLLRDGELPDVLVDGARTYTRPIDEVRTIQARRAPENWRKRSTAPMTVHVIRRCDGEHRTPETSDDC